MLQTFVAEKSYTHLIQLCYSMLSRAIATSDQLMLGLHICKFAYPQKVPDKVLFYKFIKITFHLTHLFLLGMGIIHHEFYVE